MFSGVGTPMFCTNVHGDELEFILESLFDAVGLKHIACLDYHQNSQLLVADVPSLIHSYPSLVLDTSTSST